MGKHITIRVKRRKPLDTKKLAGALVELAIYLNQQRREQDPMTNSSGGLE
jgi:hypothetical protein